MYWKKLEHVLGRLRPFRAGKQGYINACAWRSLVLRHPRNRKKDRHTIFFFLARAGLPEERRMRAMLNGFNES